MTDEYICVGCSDNSADDVLVFQGTKKEMYEEFERMLIEGEYPTILLAKVERRASARYDVEDLDG